MLVEFGHSSRLAQATSSRNASSFHHACILPIKVRQIHARLLSLARAWGTRGSGLGLLTCVVTDDSELGQGTLPPQAGVLNFDFYNVEQSCVHITLTRKDIVLFDNEDDDDDESTTRSKQKRQKTQESSAVVTTAVPRGASRLTRSTAELFFASVQQAGGDKSGIPETRLFSLLSDVRLAKAFYSQESRVAAIQNRLSALVAILYAHPSQEITSGYFQAQPELTLELIDLLRPTVSSASVSAAAAAHSGQDLQCISALADSPQVPYAVRGLAIEALTALVARRDGTSGGLTGVARQSNVLSELGVGKGMYLGLLPTLIRYSLASLNTFLSMDDETTGTKTENAPSSMDTAETIGMNLGLAFVKATKPTPLPLGEQLRRALEFVDAVLTLTSSVVSAPSGTAALTDCGLIPALLSTVAIDAKSNPSILSETSVLSPQERSQARSLLRFITAQSIQIIEGAVVTHTNALSAFHDLKGVDVLMSRLSVEMEAIRQATADKDSTPTDESGDVRNG